MTHQRRHFTDSHVAHKLNLEVITFGQPTLMLNHRLERVNERARWPSQQPETTQAPLVSHQHPGHPLSPFVIEIMISIFCLGLHLELTCFCVFPSADIRMSKPAEAEKAGATSPLEGAGNCAAPCALLGANARALFFFFSLQTQTVMC